jgi:hypothetical protein
MCGKMRGKGHVNSRGKRASKGMAIVAVNSRQIFLSFIGSFALTLDEIFMNKFRVKR